ncbi:MAG: PAS domain-containing protein [Acidaminobacteraceae bacterium]
MSKKLNPILERYIPLVHGVANTFGSNCEVVLHDFSNLQSSIVEIANGQVTGRDIGSPMTEVSLNKVNNGNTEEDIYNYTGKSTDGRVLKSSTMFIKDDNGNVIGCFCINFDMTELVAAKNVMGDIMKVASDVEVKEESGNKINDVLTDIVNQTIEAKGKPIAYLTKEEKVAIVNKLDKQGAFLIKGAIDYVAKVLCVSRYTIYNYLDEIRV